MTELTMEDLQNKAPAFEAEQTTETVVEQDPLKTELEKVQKKEGRTHDEKILYKFNELKKEVKERGLLPEEADPVETADDDSPVTVGMLKKMQQDAAAKTALQLADDISDESERELTKHHLSNSIRPTGNPSEDLRRARAIVNEVKNRQIVEEITRKTPAKAYSSASSAPLRQTIIEPELSAEELAFTRPPFNMTKEQILKTRK